MQHLLKNVRISRVMGSIDPLKASTANYSRAVDMQGFETACFIALGSSKQDGAAPAYIRIQGAASTTATFYSLLNTTASSTMGHGGATGWSSNSLSEKVLCSEVVSPLSSHRHLRAILVASSSGTYGGMICIQYGCRSRSSNLWKGSTRAGSTRWLSTQIGGQTVAVTPSVTTATTK